MLGVGAGLEAARARRGEATAFAGGKPMPAPAAFLDTALAAGPFAANRELREGLAALEDRLGRESALSAALRPAAQTLLARHLGYGNSQVVVGRQGWLFFRTEFDYLTGPPFLAARELARRRKPGSLYAKPAPDPVPALLELRAELAERGVELVFFPVPVKAQVYPGKLLRPGGFGAADSADRLPIENPSFPELVRRLREAGVPVYDALPDLRAAALEGEPLYFATDTHWNARGMRVAAAGLARFLERETGLSPQPPAGLRRRGLAHEFEGDLARLLGAGGGGVGATGALFPAERTELDEIIGLGEIPYRATSAAASDVLLLGDSYSLVFSALPGDRSASFAEQLAFALDRPVRRSAKLAANDLADRVHWLRLEPELLGGTRVVIYEVTARALSSADWSVTRIHP